MLEKVIEKHLCENIRHAGGMAIKFTSPQRRSVPDRIVLRPGDEAATKAIQKLIYISDRGALDLAHEVLRCYIRFVECKSTTGKLTDGQAREIARFKKLGFTVDVVNSKEAVDNIL